MYQKQLEALKKEFLAFPKHTTGKPLPTLAFRTKVLDLHYSSGMSMYFIAKATTIHSTTLCKWKKAEGDQRTAFTHGKYIRYDVRTKSMAVQELVNGATYEDVATKYFMSVASIKSWERLYGTKYDLYLDLPDGVPHIIKEEKHIYGNINIGKIAIVLRQQRDQLTKMLDDLQKGNA